MPAARAPIENIPKAIQGTIDHGAVEVSGAGKLAESCRSDKPNALNARGDAAGPPALTRAMSSSSIRAASISLLKKPGYHSPQSKSQRYAEPADPTWCDYGSDNTGRQENKDDDSGDPIPGRILPTIESGLAVSDILPAIGPVINEFSHHGTSLTPILPAHPKI
jgi:hypothetical protein